MNTTQTVVANINAGRRIYQPRWNASRNCLTEQGRAVLDIIRRDGRITRLTALHYGIPNLTARITELRAEGFAVDCEVKLDANGNKYGSWFIAEAEGV